MGSRREVLHLEKEGGCILLIFTLEKKCCLRVIMPLIYVTKFGVTFICVLFIFILNLINN